MLTFLSTSSARRTTESVGALDAQVKFLSTSSARRTTSRLRQATFRISFLSTSSARRTTFFPVLRTQWLEISIHVLREEDDTEALSYVEVLYNFYPRPPRGGRPGVAVKIPDTQNISIHVLREEDDALQRVRLSTGRAFLSTSSARRTTTKSAGLSATWRYFYPRPPRGGRPYPQTSCSIRSIFLSTSSARRTTLRLMPSHRHGKISIHVLREEDDAGMIDQVTMDLYFYPRPPRGGRPSAYCGIISPMYFYPRPPRGGRPFAWSAVRELS